MDRVAAHREFAQRKYDALKHGHEIGHVKAWYTPDGEIREPFNVTMFAAGAGEHTVSADQIDPNAEFQLFWKGIPDFGITHYEVFPHEHGWAATQRYGGTATDGTTVVAHQAEFVTTDEALRIVRVERYKDMAEWQAVWALATGKTIEEVSAALASAATARQRVEGEQ